MTPLELQDKLARFLEERLGAPVQVRRLERNTEGFSQETFSFDAELRGETRRYVAKREPPAGLLEPYDLEPEFRVLHGLSGEGILSPPTPWFSDDPAVLERPFYVMERLPGEVPLPTAGASGSGPFTAGRARGAGGPGRRGARAPARGRLAAAGLRVPRRAFFRARRRRARARALGGAHRARGLSRAAPAG